VYASLPPLGSRDVDLHQANLEGNGFTILENAFGVAQRTSLLDELDRLQSVRPGGDFPKSAFTGR